LKIPFRAWISHQINADSECRLTLFVKENMQAVTLSAHDARPCHKAEAAKQGQSVSKKDQEYEGDISIVPVKPCSLSTPICLADRGFK